MSTLASARREWSFTTRLEAKRVQFALARARGELPVVTYATWRTASTSVHHAIRASCRIAAVKAHALDRHNIGGGPTSVFSAFSRARTHVGDWAVHRHVLAARRRADWVVMVRDPLAMALSAAALEFRATSAGLPSPSRLDELLGSAPIGRLDWWLEHDMRPSLGWSVLDIPFDRDRGWTETEFALGRVLVMRADVPDPAKGEVLSRFLGTAVRVARKNDAQSGGRGGVLGALIQRLEAHPSLRAASLAQRSARHFWHEDQLLRLRAA
jgi:hypothetical protein